MGKLLALVVVLTLFRFAYIGWFDLIPDEAYYWSWSLAPDWCYFDQPAGIAWADKFFTTLFGDTARGVRAGAVILGLIGTLFVYLLARKVDLSKKEAAVSAALFHLVPLFAAGHVLMLHDTVMLCALAVAFYFFTRGVFENRIVFWLGGGVFMALALYAKFSAALLAIGLLIFIGLSKPRRALLLSPGPYLGAVVCAILFAPVILWNARHEWIALLAVQRLAQEENWTVVKAAYNFLDFLGSQAGLITPILFIMILAASFGVFKKRKDPVNEKRLYLACLFWGVFGYFIFQSFRAKVQGNWAAMAYLPGLLLVVNYQAAKIREGNVRWKRWWPIGIGLAIFATAVIHIQPVYPIIPLPQGKDMTDQVYGYEKLGRHVNEILVQHPDLKLITRRYQVASELQFYVKGHPEIYVANYSTRGNQYDLINDWVALEGKSALYVDVILRSSSILAHFETENRLPSFFRKRRGRPIQEIHLTILKSFHINGPLESYFKAPLSSSAATIRNRLAQ